MPSRIGQVADCLVCLGIQLLQRTSLPKVGSSVISLKRYEKPVVEVEDEKLMFKIIRASFNQRRKTLANGLNNFGGMGLTKEQIQQSIEALGVPVNVRGEALSLEQFAQLSNIIGAAKKE